MKQRKIKFRILFGIVVFIASLILTFIGYPILGISGGLIGLYFVFIK